MARDTGGFHGQHFFAAAAENEWISTLQPHDLFALSSEADEQGVDIIL